MANAARVIDALGERIGELVPERDFSVTTENDVVTVRALRGRSAGSTLHLSGSIMLALPLPTKLRLRTFFENTARDLQEFVGRNLRMEWPAPGARPHVRVTDDEVRVWFGQGDESTASLRWRPFNRDDLDL